MVGGGYGAPMGYPMMGYGAGFGYPAAAAPLSSASAGSEEGVEQDKTTIALFDVDGTLTEPRLKSEPEMREFLHSLRKRVLVGIVGGSDYKKIKEQVGDDLLESFDYVFGENGLTAYKAGEELESQSFASWLGEENLKELINFILRYIADMEDVPVKRGTFVEFRNGMLNVSPIGRACSYEERVAFNEWDAESGARKTMKAAIEAEFGDRFGLTVSIGGMISMDIFPRGWDKTYCLRHLEDSIETIHFFGDKTYKGGNDHEIFESDATIGHTVTSPADTRAQCTELFF